jgi:hypothetical protein
MTDRNGTEIKTGNIVRITGAYFKNDNGLYYVEHSPGDPGWCGKDHCLKKISKTGKISKATYNICFWPIMVTVSGPKYYEAKRWNAENAQIEVMPSLKNMSEVAGFFREKAASVVCEINRLAWNFGEDHPTVLMNREIAQHYEMIAQAIQG